MTKIEAIEKTIYNLENDMYPYKWDKGDNCNCGILARTITGKVPSAIGHSAGHWSEKFIRCDVIGTPMPEVYRALKDTGFVYKDILNLEYYGDERIAKRLGLVQDYHTDGRPFGYKGKDLSDKPLLIAYLKAWLQILKEESVAVAESVTIEPPVPPTPAPIHIYHAVQVPETISKQSDELILN